MWALRCRSSRRSANQNPHLPKRRHPFALHTGPPYSSHMNILFIHQNFPGQFKFLAPALASQGHRVVALMMQKTTVREWQGVQLWPYQVDGVQPPTGVHPWLSDLNTKVLRGQACFRAARELQRTGFQPDVIVAHPGWGESLFIKDVWPNARLGIYCEFYYQAQGADLNFDPEFPNGGDLGSDSARIRLKNTNNQLHFETADLGISPTQWQASTFPAPFREKITVIHDGIDTTRLAPQAGASLALNKANGTVHQLTRQDTVITFVSRNLEPYRGYHVFMRALPELLRQAPHAHVVLVGADGVSYGPPPDPRVHGKRSWRDIFAAEVKSAIPQEAWQRVHFVGKLPYADYVTLMQVSTVHVYLSYPFVLSWSLLEAMSLGCAIVASQTAPLRDVIRHDVTGRLVDFFDPQALVNEVCHLLADPSSRVRLGREARAFAQRYYDLKTVCLPAQLAWIDRLRA